MTNDKERSTGLLHASDELRKLLIENPGLPLLIFAGQEATCDDWYYSSCSRISASKGEFLDCEHRKVHEEQCYTDRDEFEEDLYNNLDDEFDGTDEEYEIYIQNKLKEYEPYWKPAIIVYVNN